jgi:hypothetical protein
MTALSVADEGAVEVDLIVTVDLGYREHVRELATFRPSPAPESWKRWQGV